MDNRDPEPDPSPSPQHDGIYRAIIALMLANLFVGGLLIILGEAYFKNPQVTQFGFILGLVGAVFYLLFRWLAERAAKRDGQ